jgi:hypothetical protein
MEYHAGPNNWITKVYDWQLYTEALLAWARESRALQWYMWNSGKSGREEGIHGILDLAGRPTERMTAVTRISAFAQPSGFHGAGGLGGVQKGMRAV